METGKKKNTVKAGGEGLINEMQAVKLKYSFWLGDGRQKRSSSTESLYLLSDSATGDSEMPANQGHCLPLGSNALLHTGTEVTAGPPAQPNRSSDMSQAKKHGKRQKYQHPNPQILRAKTDEEIIQSDLIYDWIVSPVISP